MRADMAESRERLKVKLGVVGAVTPTRYAYGDVRTVLALLLPGLD